MSRRGRPQRVAPVDMRRGERRPFGGSMQRSSTMLSEQLRSAEHHVDIDGGQRRMERGAPPQLDRDQNGTRLWKRDEQLLPPVPAGALQAEPRSRPPRQPRSRHPEPDPGPFPGGPAPPARARSMPGPGPSHGHQQEVPRQEVPRRHEELAVPARSSARPVPQPPVAGELPGGLGQLAVFFSSHGGTGASTLAVNTAVTLARAGRSVCVVDLDLQLGDALTVLGLEPKCPMSKIAREMETFDWEMLGPMLARHESGVCVVSQVGCLEELNELTVSRIPELLRYLQARFEYVVVDGVRDFNDHALAAMDVADQIVIVVTQDVPAVRGVSRRLSIFRRLGYPTSKIRVVTNRYSKGNPITLRAITSAIGTEPNYTVANDFGTVHRAITEGLALYQVDPNSAVSRQVTEMTCKLFDLPLPAAAAGVSRGPKRSFFSRILKKH